MHVVVVTDDVHWLRMHSLQVSARTCAADATTGPSVTWACCAWQVAQRNGTVTLTEADELSLRRDYALSPAAKALRWCERAQGGGCGSRQRRSN